MINVGELLMTSMRMRKEKEEKRRRRGRKKINPRSCFIAIIQILPCEFIMSSLYYGVCSKERRNEKYMYVKIIVLKVSNSNNKNNMRMA